MQGKLIAEVDAEGAKYGDDVKYLADFTGGVKKFDPWMVKSEAKKSVGMFKPKNYQEAVDQLEDAEVRVQLKMTSYKFGVFDLSQPPLYL